MAPKTPKTNAALEKKIRTAVIELDKLGTPLTNANVRQKIGGCSFRDLSPILKAIKTERETRAREESLVPDMPEEVAELATAFWETAYRAADEAAAASRRAHAEEVAGLRVQLDQWETDVGTVEDELAEMTARAEGAAKTIAGLEEQISDLRLVIAGLEGRLLGRQEATPAEYKADTDLKTASDLEGTHQMQLFDEQAGDNGGEQTESGDRDEDHASGDLDDEAA